MSEGAMNNTFDSLNNDKEKKANRQTNQQRVKEDVANCNTRQQSKNRDTRKNNPQQGPNNFDNKANYNSADSEPESLCLDKKARTSRISNKNSTRESIKTDKKVNLRKKSKINAIVC